MKVIKSMFAVTCLLAAVENVFAEDNWQFLLETGSSWIECSSYYTSSTADALGCSANPPYEKSTGLIIQLNKKSEPAGLGFHAASTTNNASATPSFDELELEPDVFWTMDNGETLTHSQILISAMMQAHDVELALSPGFDIKPVNLNIENAMTALMVPLRANDPGR